jgi:hypothetical protein
MVSIDTPESKIGGAPETAQRTPGPAARLEAGAFDEIDEPLRKHLYDRLTADAAERHLSAGARAGVEFERMRSQRLEFNPDTGRAKVGIIVTGEAIEENGRLLGYVTPWLTPPLPPRDDPRRRTFNLELIETGWPVFFPIYPSLPRDADLNLALQAAETAWGEQARRLAGVRRGHAARLRVPGLSQARCRRSA